MKREICALEENGVWTLENLPEGKCAIDSKRVYKVKYKHNGDVEWYTTCLVAKGFTQIKGVDHHDTFTLVSKLVTIQTLLAEAVKRDWSIQQLDINNTFLYRDLNEELYMKLRQLFAKEGETKASNNWYQEFTNAILELGFNQSKADHSLFIHCKREGFVVALIYVDDVIILGDNTQKIIKDLDELKYFLRIEVACTSEGLVLSQRKYILDLPANSGLQVYSLSSFPIKQNLKLTKVEAEPQVDASQNCRMVGGCVLIAYYDSDWLGCLFTGKSRNGYLLLLGNAPISWKTKNQSSQLYLGLQRRRSTDPLSLLLVEFYGNLDVNVTGPSLLFCDNQVELHIVTILIFHGRTKHVEMDCYIV
uniref:Reverse transcriptase Ty1/copia-type domain-containing protein n=1 Tax=Lactuca sativa TaxID=4236 RepID=A0A9R1W8L2_LACSA|nr:hypothetical protein LSAT_V11C200053520 [Lactuca sativa]